MKVTLEINDIDYKALVEQFLPMVKDKLSDSDTAGSKVLAKIAGMPPSVAAKMVDMLPESTKNELAVKLINKNKAKITESITDYAAKKGISFSISKFDVTE